MAPPLVVPILSQRGPDIVVPLFETPFFAPDAGADSVCNSRFTAFRGAGVTGSVIYRPDVVSLNTSKNVLTTDFAGGQFICVVGNNAGAYTRKAPTTTRHSQKCGFGFDIANPTESTGAMAGGDPVMSQCFEMYVAESNGPMFGQVFNQGILGNWGLNVFDANNPTLNATVNAIVDWSGGGYIGPVSGVPDYVGGNNYIWGGTLPTGGPQNNIVRWGNRPSGDARGTVYQLSFADPGINAQMGNSALGTTPVRPIRSGWIVTGLDPTGTEVAATQTRDVIVLNFNGSQWQRVRLVQTPRGSVAIKNGAIFPNYALHVDVGGYLYMIDYTDGGRLYTSFGLDIPLVAPAIQGFPIPGLSCFGSCYPVFVNQPAS